MTMDLKHLTYAEYLALPEMKARYSIVDGELVMAAAPTPDHQRVVQRTFVKLDAFVQERQIGTVFLAPLDVVIRRDPLRTRRALEEKLRDYQSINVREAWIIATQGQTVEVLQLSAERKGIERLGLYGLGDLIVSQVLSELQLTVDEIFPE
jgi:Uma2 family endonuclease